MLTRPVERFNYTVQLSVIKRTLYIYIYVVVPWKIDCLRSSHDVDVIFCPIQPVSLMIFVRIINIYLARRRSKFMEKTRMDKYLIFGKWNWEWNWLEKPECWDRVPLRARATARPWFDSWHDRFRWILEIFIIRTYMYIYIERKKKKIKETYRKEKETNRKKNSLDALRRPHAISGLCPSLSRGKWNRHHC